MEKLFSSMQEILAPVNCIVYEIPEFQREYAWGKDQWNALFDDIEANDPGYFIGSIICISGKASGQNEAITYQVIDGQQRLTTVSLLLLAIVNKIDISEIISTYGPTSSQFTNYVTALRMLRYDDKNKESYRLILQDGNNQDFNFLVLKCLDKNERNKPKNFGNRRISLAYEHFNKRLDKMREDFRMSLLEKILRTNVVSINVDDETKAFLLFEALNNRGLPLSIIDLINTNVVKEASRLGVKKECYDNWMEMKRNLGDEPKVQERFLRHYYNSIIRDAYSQDKSTRAKRSNLLDLYKSEVGARCKDLVDDLLSASEIYARISTNKKSPDDDRYYNDLLDLNHAEGSTSYALLLYLIKNKTALSLDDDILSKIISTLVNFFLIRTLTEKPATRDLDEMFMSIIDQIRVDHSDVYATIVGTLKNYQDVTKDEIIRELHKDVYTEYQGATRFFLSYFETNSDGNKGKSYNKYWERDEKGRLKWTIEHVLPETKGDLPDGWIKMLDASENKDAAKEIQIANMHRLGNLTLTPYNSELSNAPLDNKQNATREKGGYKTTNLFLNGDMNSSEITAIKSATQWTKTEIDKRTNFLASKFVAKIFPIDNTNDIYS